MAIDPKLVSIKTAGELPVSDPSDNANFLFYEGDKLQTSPMSNIYDKVSSGLLPATTATVPEATGFHRYLVHTAGTYTNFSGIVVATADLDIVNGVANNEVILEVNNGVASKKVRRLKGDKGDSVKTWTATSYASGTQVFHNGEIWESNATTIAVEIPGTSAKWVPKLDQGFKDNLTRGMIPYVGTGYYLTTTGSLYSSTNFHTAKIPVSEGDVFVNRYKGAGNSAQAVFFDANGAFVSFVQNQDSIVIPSGVAFVAFNSDSQTKVIISPIKNYVASVLSNLPKDATGGLLLPDGFDLAKEYKVTNNTSARALTGFYGDALGNENTSSTSFFRSQKIPVREGVIKYKGAHGGNIYTMFYDSNGVVIKYIVGTSLTTPNEFDIVIDKYTAFIATSCASGATLSLKIVGEMNMAKDVTPLPNYYRDGSVNPIISIDKAKRFSFEFQCKGDMFTDSSWLSLIGGNALSIEVSKALTTSVATDNVTVHNNDFRTKNAASALNTLGKNLSSPTAKIFEGEQMFSLRYKGALTTLSMESKNGALTIYNGASVVASYSYATYPLLSDLYAKINTDIASGPLTDFEFKWFTAGKVPSTEIATFEKVAFNATINTYVAEAWTTNTKQVFFPVYVYQIDRSWHKVEVIFTPSNWFIRIDDLVYRLGYSNTTRTFGGELLLNNTDFNYREIKVSNEIDWSEPLVKTVYMHGTGDNIGDNIDKLLIFDKEMKKRGFVSITYSQLLKFYNYGESIPKRSYVICFDDSRHPLYTEAGIRQKLMSQGVKVNNSMILIQDEGDEEVYFKAPSVTVAGALAVGNAFPVGNGVATYLGLSEFDGKRIFKLKGSRKPLNTSIVLNTAYTSGSVSVTFTADIILAVDRTEVPPSEWSYLIQDLPKELDDYGFEAHLHDLRHQEPLNSMTYEELTTNINDAIWKFRQRYGYFATGMVYPYGNITAMHARECWRLGMGICYTSSELKNRVSSTKRTSLAYMMERKTLDITMDGIYNYFTYGDSALDYYLP